MKMITIKLTNGTEIIVDEFKLEKILNLETQLIQLTNWKGEKTGSGFNKAYIVEFFEDQNETNKINRQIEASKRIEGKEIPVDCPQTTLDAIEVYKYYKQQTKSLTI